MRTPFMRNEVLKPKNTSEILSLLLRFQKKLLKMSFVFAS